MLGPNSVCCFDAFVVGLNSAVRKLFGTKILPDAFDGPNSSAYWGGKICVILPVTLVSRLLDATVAITGNLFAGIPRMIAELRPPADISRAARVSTSPVQLKMRGEMRVDRGELGLLPVINPSMCSHKV